MSIRIVLATTCMHPSGRRRSGLALGLTADDCCPHDCLANALSQIHQRVSGPYGATTRDDARGGPCSTRSEVSEPQHHAHVERDVGERARGLDATKSDRRLKPAIPNARRQAPRAAQRQLETAAHLQSQRVLGVRNEQAIGGAFDLDMVVEPTSADPGPSSIRDGYHVAQAERIA